MNFNNLRVKEILGVVRYRPNIQSWVASSRTCHIIGIQVSGSVLHVMENQSFVINGDCVYFLNRKDDFRTKVYVPSEAFSIHFTTDEPIDTESFCIPVTISHGILTILQKAEAARAEGNELSVLSLFYELCDLLERARAKAYATGDPRMMKAKAYIDSHLADESCIENAVAISKVGKRRFRDLFKRSFDTTPTQYATVKRIMLAQNLLSAGGVSVGEVANQCGFSDVYYFSKVFKQICGVSPSKWR